MEVQRSQEHVSGFSKSQGEGHLENAMGQCRIAGGTLSGPHQSSSSCPPPEYSDPSTIQAPENLTELVTRLHDIFAGDAICVEYVQKLMESYKGNPREWKKFAKFDKYRYTRNLVDAGNGKFNLMILCWNEAQGSSIHSHANSHCFLKVLNGSVKEELYEWPDDGDGDTRHSSNNNNTETGGSSVDGGDTEADPGMRKWAENVLDTNECGYINDNIGLHRVENPSHMNKAVTLHLYSPPFDECECFDERTGKHTTSSVTFFSKYGKRTPFGRHPNRVITEETSVENN